MKHLFSVAILFAWVLMMGLCAGLYVSCPMPTVIGLSIAGGLAGFITTLAVTVIYKTYKLK